MHAKVVLSVSGALILAGTLLLKATEDISWLGALFHSVSARTAGFSTYPLKTFSNAGLLALTALMFIGASPGSTGGGVKVSRLVILCKALGSELRKLLHPRSVRVLTVDGKPAAHYENTLVIREDGVEILTL